MAAEGDLSARLFEALTLDRQDRLEEAAAICEDILAARPKDPHVLCLLGRIRRRQNRLDEAALLLDQARSRAPKLPQLIAECGFLALNRSDARAAIRHFSALLALRPGVADTHFNLACGLEMAGMFGEAAAHLNRALELEPSKPHEVLARLGSALLMTGRQDAAAERFEAALELDPRDASALYGMGMVRSAKGEFEAAGELFRRALAIDPDLVDACQQLAVIRRFDDEADPDLQMMRGLLERPGCSPLVREKLNFALGKVHDDLGEYGRAFAHFEAANRLKRARMPRFDREAHRALVDRVVATFSMAFFSDRSSLGSQSRVPLPIFGMPRSGTTLVEQIVSSHSRVAGGGEHIHFERLSQSFREEWPGVVCGWDAAAVDAAAGAYLAVLQRSADGVDHVTDKMPANFMHAGLVHLLFPQARLVHCRRDPVDTCLSIFFLDFGVANYYANDLEDIAFYYNEYARLMAHWRAVLPDAVHDVEYAALVTDQERVTRELLAFCGLEWQDACLDFAGNERAVPTPSRWQVRQPMYSRSLGRREHYAPYIARLTEALQVS